MAKPPLDLPALFPEICRIADPAIRDGVEQVWQRLWQESAFERLEDVPVSPGRIPVSQYGHFRAVPKLVVACAEIWRDVHGTAINLDVLIAAALLVDVAKIVENEPKDGGPPGKSALGKRLPHGLYAAHVALEVGLPLDVIHIIMSHSPNSGKAPDSLEGQLIHWLDQADVAALGFDIWKREVVHHHI
ncbi:MAG: HD domain-containing protein [Dehalococcoidia bacterium]